MNQKSLAQYSLNNFKRKRKSHTEPSSYQNLLNEEDEGIKRLIMDDDYESISDNSSSTTPLHSSYIDHNIKQEDQLPADDYFSSDGSTSIISKRSTTKIKSEPKSYHREYNPTRSEFNIKMEDYNDQDTFCVDMSRFNNFKTSSTSISNLYNTDFHNFESPLTKMESSSPVRIQNNRRNRSQVFKPHRHNKNVTVPRVPCKGPACKSQICCAQFCSQSCYMNQMQPIGTGGLKNMMVDYDSTPQQQEINVTDYGLPYPDHTYCHDHKNVYFSSDIDVDAPPYVDLVEQLFYDEKELRIKNPRPEPNINGDPISTNGYQGGGGGGSGACNSVKRGRPKRSNVIGLLDPYIFHPSTDVVYTPFLFRENIIEADRHGSLRQVKLAIRQSTCLYREVRADVPIEVIYGGTVRTAIVGGGGAGAGAREMGGYGEPFFDPADHSDDDQEDDDDDDDGGEDDDDDEEVDFSRHL